MKTFNVTVRYETTYYDVEATDEEEAKDIVYEWFAECEPNFTVEEVTKEE